MPIRSFGFLIAFFALLLRCVAVRAETIASENQALPAVETAATPQPAETGAEKPDTTSGTRSAYPQISFSGFGTLGFAASDQQFTYLRAINKNGTFNRDSVMGAQVDIKLFPKISLSVQGKVSQATDKDNSWKPTLTRAFVSWRPTDDFMVRAGRMFMGASMYAEHFDVGATYDFARLPPEYYGSVAQNPYTDGIDVSQTLHAGDNELKIRGMWGANHTYPRSYYRDNIPGLLQGGARYMKTDSQSVALHVYLTRDEDIYRAAWAYTIFKPEAPYPTNFPYVSLGPGVGYYQTSNSQPGPGVPTTEKVYANSYMLSTDVGLGNDFRFAGEVTYRDALNVERGASYFAGYLSLRRRIGRWTPYIIYSIARSDSTALDTYNKLNESSVPDSIPNAALINASQRAGADGSIAYDQSSCSLGASYTIPPFAGIKISKVKAEWSLAHIGDVSALVDGYNGVNPHNKLFNVFSLSYNFVF